MNSQDNSCSLTTHLVLAYRMISNELPPCFFAVLLAIYVYMLRSKLFFPIGSVFQKSLRRRTVPEHHQVLDA